MPSAQVSEGVELQWEARGEGPMIVLVDQCWGYPEVWEGLLADLATDHRVVVYGRRGTGASTRRGPYELDTDTTDLVALLEQLGGADALLAAGDGCIVAVRAAAAHPELAKLVISHAGSPLAREAIAGTEGLAASDSVVEAFEQMMSKDYRAALRTVLTSMNPSFDDAAVRTRIDRTVDYVPQEAALGRLRDWIEANAVEDAQTLGNRLWLPRERANAWFGDDIIDTEREYFPEAHFTELEAGAISRPDLTSAVVREAIAALDSAPSKP